MSFLENTRLTGRGFHPRGTKAKRTRQAWDYKLSQRSHCDSNAPGFHAASSMRSSMRIGRIAGLLASSISSARRGIFVRALLALFCAALALGPADAAPRCKNGYVWRDAADGDGVCVTPKQRAVAKAQNANAERNRQAGGGAYGPNTCRQGFVWREAFPGDMVCVTPRERGQASRQNREAGKHSLRERDCHWSSELGEEACASSID